MAKDLAYYMDHPDEMPDDLSVIDGAVEEVGDATDNEQVNEDADAGEGKQVEKSAATGATKQPAGVKEGVEGEPNGESTEAQPAGKPVLKSKDGKHEIPYQVLENERRARQEAEQRFTELQAQVETLMRQQQGKTTTEDQREQAQADVLSDEDLQAMEETSPEMAKAFKGLLGLVQNLREQNDMLAGKHQQQEQAQRLTLQEQVEAAIDSNPVLSYWRAEDPDMWAAATEMDKAIRNDPRNRGLSFEQRFEKVTTALQAIHGKAELPEAYRVSEAPATAPAAPAPAPKPTAQAVKETAQRVQKALAEAEDQQVQSLSDIPGGVPAGNSDLDDLAALSAHELGNKFLSMDPAKMNELLARLG